MPLQPWGGVVCPLLCGFAGDDKRVGVAMSRLALTLDTAIGKLGSTAMASWLDVKKFKLVQEEAAILSPHLKVVACLLLIQQHFTSRSCCHYFACVCSQELIATQEMRKRTRKSETGYEEILSRPRLVGKERTAIEVAARAVHQWLKKPKSPLRDLLVVLSCGGAFFCASTHTRAGAGAVSYRAAQGDSGHVGISEEEFVRGCQVHLCHGA